MTDREGMRFSLNYLVRGDPASDSIRMRRRVYQIFNLNELKSYVSADLIEMEIGASVPRGMYTYDWESFFLKAPIRDFLDTITVVASRISGSSNLTKRWVGGR